MTYGTGAKARVLAVDERDESTRTYEARRKAQHARLTAAVNAAHSHSLTVPAVAIAALCVFVFVLFA